MQQHFIELRRTRMKKTVVFVMGLALMAAACKQAAENPSSPPPPHTTERID